MHRRIQTELTAHLADLPLSFHVQIVALVGHFVEINRKLVFVRNTKFKWIIQPISILNRIKLRGLNGKINLEINVNLLVCETNFIPMRVQTMSWIF